MTKTPFVPILLSHLSLIFAQSFPLTIRTYVFVLSTFPPVFFSFFSFFCDDICEKCIRSREVHILRIGWW